MLRSAKQIPNAELSHRRLGQGRRVSAVAACARRLTSRGPQILLFSLQLCASYMCFCVCLLVCSRLLSLFSYLLSNAIQCKVCTYVCVQCTYACMSGNAHVNGIVNVFGGHVMSCHVMQCCAMACMDACNACSARM